MIRQINPEEVPGAYLHKFLLGSIAPRPIAFASTIDALGRPNLAPFSFFNAFGVNPTTLIFSPSRRGRDGSTKHTYQNLKEVPEVVINVVTYEMVHQTSLASTEYPKGVNEFVKAGFTPEPAVKIRPFRVKESPIQFECKVRQIIETGDGGGAANLVICEIVLIHSDEDVLGKDGLPEPYKIRLVGRVGGDDYVKAFDEGLFEVKKPGANPGLGIDQLPDCIKYSKILTGNNLGQLGNIDRIPSKEEATRMSWNTDVRFMMKRYAGYTEELSHEIQLFAKKLLDNGWVQNAFELLMWDCYQKEKGSQTS